MAATYDDIRRPHSGYLGSGCFFLFFLLGGGGGVRLKPGLFGSWLLYCREEMMLQLSPIPDYIHKR